MSKFLKSSVSSSIETKLGFPQIEEKPTLLVVHVWEQLLFELWIETQKRHLPHKFCWEIVKGFEISKFKKLPLPMSKFLKNSLSSSIETKLGFPQIEEKNPRF